MALCTRIIVILRTSDVGQYMIQIAFDDDASGFVSSCSFAIEKAFLAKSDLAVPIEVVLFFCFHAAHAAILILLSDFLWKFS